MGNRWIQWLQEQGGQFGARGELTEFPVSEQHTDKDATDTTDGHIVPLTDLGVIKVSGRDAAKLLQGQLTCDIHKLDDQQASLGGLCDPKGRLHSIFVIFRRQDDFYLLLPSEILTHTLTTLKKYAVFYQTDLSDVTDELAVIGLAPVPESAGLPRRPEAAFGSHTRDDISVIASPVSGQAAILVCPVGKAQELWPLMCKVAKPEATAWWQAREIEAGIPAIYGQTVGLFLPAFVGLEDAGGVSFDKGCYTGQEIVARMHYRGKLKTHVARGKISGATGAEPGAKVMLDDKSVGEIIRAAPCDGETLLLMTLADKASGSDSLTLEETSEPVTLLQ